MSNATSAGGRRLDPGLKRNLLIVIAAVAAAAALVFIMVVMRTGGAKGGGAGAVDVRALSTDGKSRPGDGALTEAQTKKLQEVQRREAAEARRNNDMYIPPDGLGRAVAIPKAPDAGAGESTAHQYTPAGSRVVSHEMSRAEQEAYARRTAGLAVQLQRYMEGEQQPGEAARVVFESTKRDGAGSSTIASQAPTARAPEADRGAIVVDSLEIFAGETASPVDTYKTRYASARVLSGKLAGAFLVGQTVLENEGLLTTYTTMRWNGRTYKIDAIALDEQTATDALDANLDRRYLQRYVMPVLMAGVGGYAQARAQTSSTTVHTGSGTVVESNSQASRTQAENAAIAAATQIAGRAIERDAALPIRATLPERTPVGVMFRAPVRQADANPDAFAQQRQPTAAQEQAAQALAAQQLAAQMSIGPMPGGVATPGFAPPARVTGSAVR